MDPSTPYRTAAAAEANRRFGAERAAKDPKRLSKAVRVVVTAVALDTYTLADLILETADAMGPMSPSARADVIALLSGAERSATSPRAANAA